MPIWSAEIKEIESLYGAHPKEFDPRQVKPVLNNLATIIEWYLKYKSTETGVNDISIDTNRILILR